MYNLRRAIRLKRSRRALFYFICALIAVLSWSRFHPTARLLSSHRLARIKAVDHGWGSIIHRFQNHPQLAQGRHRFPWTESSLFGRRQRRNGKAEEQVRVIRTLIVTSELVGLHQNGGIGTAFAELATTLSNQSEIEVSILIAKLASEFPFEQIARVTRQLQSTNITLHFIQPSARPWYPRAWSPLASISVLSFLRETDGEYDIIHFAENSGIGYFSLLAKYEGLALQNSTIVVGLHGAQIEWASMMNKHYPNDEFDLQLGVMERRSAEMADVVVSPSEYMLEYVRKRGWHLPQHSLVIPNIVSAAPAPSSSDQPSSLAPPPITELVFFGRLEERKGTRLFVEALELLLVANSTFGNQSIDTISFVGKDSFDTGANIDSSSLISEALSYLQTVSAHSFRFQFLHDYERNEAIDYLRNQSRLIVLPALADNSPSTVLECISNAVRFIASTSGGIAELVHQGDHELVLFEPRASTFAAKLSSVLKSNQILSPRPAVATSTAPLDWIRLHEWIFSLPASSPPPSTLPTPLVSICISHYERPDVLLQLLHSLRLQSYTHFEVIIVDDGSSSPAAIAFLAELESTLEEHWQILRIPNSYLGEARNRAAALAKGEYLLFLDDDDVLKSHALTTLVNVATKTGAHVLSSFLDEFASDLDPLSETTTPLPNRRSFWFSGQSIALGVLTNCFGSGNIFVQRSVFTEMGGFSTFREVGAEDWEFYMRVATHGHSQLVVPEELIYVRSSSSRLSMKFTMDEWDSSYRALLPLLNDPRVQELELTHSLMFAKSSATHDFVERPFADSRVDFEPIQGWNGWSYSFEPVDEMASLDSASTEAVATDAQWNMADEKSSAYITDATQHPYVSKKGAAFAAVRTFTSPRKADVTLRLSYSAKHQCGDGTELKLRFKRDAKKEWETLLVRRTIEQGRETFQHELSLVPGSTIDLISSPLETDECDHVELDLVLVLTRTSDAWSTLAKRSKADAMAQMLLDAPPPTVGLNPNRTEWKEIKPVVIDPLTTFSIALIFDENRLDYAQQVITSALHYIKSRTIHFHLVCPPSMHDELFALYADAPFVVHIYNHNLCTNLVRHVKPFSHPGIHTSAHCKFFLAEIITDVPRVLYIDSDASILSDISECYSRPSSPSTLISMALDMGDSCQLRPNLCWPMGLHWRVTPGLKCGNIASRVPWDASPEACAEEGDLEPVQMNGGVVLLELERMRDEDFIDRYIHSVVHHYQTVGRVATWGEQDFINSYFRLYPDHLAVLACGCNYQWFGSRREVKCGEQPVRIAHAWSHGIAGRTENPYNRVFHHFLDNSSLPVPSFPTISASTTNCTNSTILIESNVNCPTQNHDCARPVAPDNQYGSPVFILSRMNSKAFAADLVDSLASQSYSNLRHGISKSPDTALDPSVSTVDTVFIDTSSNVEKDYAALCTKCRHLANSTTDDSCHLSPSDPLEARAFARCLCTSTDSTALSREDLNALVVTPGWILYLDDDRLFVHSHSLAHLISGIDSTDQLVVFRSNATSTIQELDYEEKILTRGELDGLSYIFHSSYLNLTSWDSYRCGLFRNFEILSRGLRITWTDLVPVIQHPLARHRPGRSAQEFRITVLIFETSENPSWLEEIVEDMTSVMFKTLVKEVVVVSRDRIDGSLGPSVRIKRVAAGTGLSSLAGIADGGILLLSDSIRLDKIALTALINFWLDDPLRLLGVYTPLTSYSFPPPLNTNQTTFAAYDEPDALIGTAGYQHLLPRILLTHSSHLATLSSLLSTRSLPSVCHNILLHGIAARGTGRGPLRVLMPKESFSDRVHDCRIRSWANVTEGSRAGDSVVLDSNETYEMCLSEVGKILGSDEMSWLIETTEVGIAGVRGMKEGYEEGGQIEPARWEASREIGECLM